MDSNILWIMLCIVGVTELIKGFFKELPKWAMILITIAVGVCITCLYILLPTYWNAIRVALVAISGATVFYDTVFQLFKKLIKGDKLDETFSEGCISGNPDSLR